MISMKKASKASKKAFLNYGIVIVFFAVFQILVSTGNITSALKGQLIPITCYMIMAVSLNLDNIALMPCNPAVGGPAKSCLTREVDALGGIMGIAADATYMQMKMLNSSKGPAVRALRAQSDKKEYSAFVRNLLEKEENIFLKQCTASELMTENGAKLHHPAEFQFLSNQYFLNQLLQEFLF